MTGCLEITCGPAVFGNSNDLFKYTILDHQKVQTDVCYRMKKKKNAGQLFILFFKKRNENMKE